MIQFENTSYSAMLNIAELVPPPESVPIQFDSAIHGIPFDSEIPSDSGQFRELSQSGIGPNSENLMEVIPLTELISQFSTSRNRMTALQFSKVTRSIQNNTCWKRQIM